MDDIDSEDSEMPTIGSMTSMNGTFPFFLYYLNLTLGMDSMTIRGHFLNGLVSVVLLVGPV